MEEGRERGEITPVRYRVWHLLPALLLLACSVFCLIRAIEWWLDTRGSSSNSRDSAGSSSASTPAGSSSSSSVPVLSTAAAAGVVCGMAASATLEDSLSGSLSSSSSFSPRVSIHVSMASEDKGSAEAGAIPLEGLGRAAMMQQQRRQGEVAATDALGAAISAVEPMYLAADAERDGPGSSSSSSSGCDSEDKTNTERHGVEPAEGRDTSSLLPPPKALEMGEAPLAEAGAPCSQPVEEPRGERAEVGLGLKADEEPAGGNEAQGDEAKVDEWELGWDIDEAIASLMPESYDSVDDAYRELELRMEELCRAHNISDRSDMRRRAMLLATSTFITKWALGSDDDWPTEGAEGEHWHAAFIKDRTWRPWRVDEQ